MQTITRTPDGDTELNYLVLFKQLIRHLPLMLAAGAAATVIFILAALLLLDTAYTYKAYVNLKATETLYDEETNEPYEGAMQQGTLTILVKNSEVLGHVLELMDDDEMTVQLLMEQVTTSSISNSSILRITVTDESQETAELILEGIMEALPDYAEGIIEGCDIEYISTELSEEITEPNTLQIAVTGFLLGFILAAVVVIIRACSDKVVHEAADLNAWPDIPVLGEPSEQRQEEADVSLRLTLGQQKPGIVIAGVQNETAVQETSRRLAENYAAAGCRTLLVHTSMREGEIGQGLAGYLEEAVGYDAIMLPTADHLWEVEAGRSAAQPAGLISGFRMRTLVQDYAGDYDVVLYDAAAVNVHPDALALMKAGCGLLLIVQEEKTSLTEIETALNHLHAAGETPLGFIAVKAAGKR